MEPIGNDLQFRQSERKHAAETLRDLGLGNTEKPCHVGLLDSVAGAQPPYLRTGPLGQ